MSDLALTVSLLRASADGYAGLAAGRLFEERSELAATNGAGFDAWRANLRGQILSLAAAVEDESTEGFAARVAWTRDSLSSRDIETAVLGAAVEALRETLRESLPEDGWRRVEPHVERAEAELARPAAALPCELDSAAPHAELARELFEALSELDDARAFDLISEALDAGRLGAADVLEHVLAPVQREFGRLWHVAELTVAEEHLTTLLSRRILERVLARGSGAPPTGRTVLVASVAGDVHDLGPLLVSARFELEGWRALCLGADVPAEDLVDLVARAKPDLVALGATLDTHRAEAARTVRLLHAADPDLRVLVGGSAFAEAGEPWRRTGADACASSPGEAVRAAEALLSS